jgi:hypothetical protein
MEDISDFSLEKMQTVVDQGAYYKESTLEACIQELKDRGLLSDAQIEEHRKRIDIKKLELNKEGALYLSKENKSYTFEWKFRYSVYLFILVVLLAIYIYQVTGLIVWYLPTGVAVAASTRFKGFKNRIKKD